MGNNRKQIKYIWMVSREYGDLAGAGGVKDVVSQLAEALARWSGRSVHVVLPCYGFMDSISLGFSPLMDPEDPEKVLQCEIDMDHPDERRREKVRYFFRKINKVSLYLVDSGRFREKQAVYTYTAEEEQLEAWQKESSAHYDYFAMNILLQKAAMELMVLLDARPDVIHCHDGHTAVLPAMIRELPGYRSYFRSSGCLVTIHNAGLGYHQEVADLPYACAVTGLAREIIDDHLLDGKFDPFLAAGSYGLLNTVSENYARELQETESDRLTGWLGHALLARKVRIEGVTNGIDPLLFNPADTGEEEKFSFDPGNIDDDLQGKKECRIAFLKDLQDWKWQEKQYGTLDSPGNGPLFTFIGRLSEQKGVDLLLEVLPVLFESRDNVQVMFLGSGDVDLEDRLKNFSDNPAWQKKICFIRGYSPDLARRIYSAGDFFLIPSRFEPCGLTDFIAQLFGNVPVVHLVGGLVKVKDGLTGIGYENNSPDSLLDALQRALALYADKENLRLMQLQGVREIEKKYTWSRVMKRYVALYEQAGLL
ncbi:glycogen synthase [Desulfomarina sp.]